MPQSLPLKRFVLIALLIICCLPISGCWDRREIQDRSFVLAVAIDKGEADKQSQKQTHRLDPHIVPNYDYELSLQLLKLTPSRSGGESPSQAESGKTFVLSQTGGSLFELIRDMTAKISKSLWFEHIQVLFISEELLKEKNIDPIIDFFRRDAEMRWNMRVFITSGPAKKLLDYQPPTGEPGGLFFSGTARNVIKNPQLATTEANLGYVIRSLDNDADFILPRIEMEGKEVKIFGMGLFKKGVFSGYVDDYTVKGVKILRGLERSMLVSTECPDHPGEIVTYEVFRNNTNLEPHVENGNIYFTSHIVMRGNMGSGACAKYHKSKDPAFLDRVTDAFAREVERNIQFAVKECQRREVDVLGFALHLKAYKPKEWEKIKDRWPEVFPNIPVYTKVHISINNMGEHK